MKIKVSDLLSMISEATRNPGEYVYVMDLSFPDGKDKIKLPGADMISRRVISRDQLGMDLSGFEPKEMDDRRYAGKVGLFNAETGEWMKVGQAPIRRKTIEEIEDFVEEMEGGQLKTWKTDFFNRIGDLPLVIIDEGPDFIEYEVISTDESPADTKGMVQKYHDDQGSLSKGISDTEEEWMEKRKRNLGSRFEEGKKKAR
tara:strand:- start:11633 stop:12232 length:600 start_codon:yes stop_codon:yes gene_type:complete